MTLPFSRRTQLLVASIAAVVLATAGGVLVKNAVSSRLAAARAVADVARKQAVVATQDADSAKKLAAAMKDSADAAKRASAAAAAKADTALVRAARARGAFSQISKAAPDTCKSIIVAADSALAADSATIVDLRSVHTADTVAISKLTQANDTLTASLSRLGSATHGLITADQQLSKAAKPGFLGFLTKVLPHPVVAGVLPVYPLGKPAVAVGLGWSF